MSEPKIVKRYANRKLYDTERSCYVTLDDISMMIKTGEEVRVVDNKSGEDLTTVTLAQIIFEAEKKKNFMPMSLLRDLIRDSGDALGDFAREQAERVQARANEFKETADKLRHDTLETAEKLKQETLETADKLREDLKERLDVVMHGKGADDAGDKTQKENEAKGAAISVLVEHTQRTFDELQRKVEERVKEGLGVVERTPRLDKDMNEISERLAALEQRLGKAR